MSAGSTQALGWLATGQLTYVSGYLRELDAATGPAGLTMLPPAYADLFAAVTARALDADLLAATSVPEILILKGVLVAVSARAVGPLSWRAADAHNGLDLEMRVRYGDPAYACLHRGDEQGLRDFALVIGSATAAEDAVARARRVEVLADRVETATREGLNIRSDPDDGRRSLRLGGWVRLGAARAQDVHGWTKAPGPLAAMTTLAEALPVAGLPPLGEVLEPHRQVCRALVLDCARLLGASAEGVRRSLATGLDVSSVVGLFRAVASPEGTAGRAQQALPGRPRRGAGRAPVGSRPTSARRH